ncbi:uncharacterized protein E6C27_scaffold675G001340 [Cucumis melo var. makuwa]|uniref:Uncharacterized protein n=1 Tax=Cucumis melo var. makuwa TaxID=1194695 RepID=A0A5A7U6X2_CUCMM|nr:uncharacterized protein E6C27_scaffold675G001340 [Cucumis melo var. makuwa]
MFKNLENAKNLCWHTMDKKVDGIMRHPADTPSWRLIDYMWPTFGSEPRNLHLATQKTTNAFGEEDILTRALGGKDRPRILCGVGKYVTKKKYFHTATQQKTNEKEDEKATSKEYDRMAKRIKELEDELLKMKDASQRIVG